MVDACDRLSIEKPVLQAGMGDVARAMLVNAVAFAGGLGTLGYRAPEDFSDEIVRIKDALGKRSFAVNLLMPVITRSHVEACLSHKVPIVTIFYGFKQSLVDALKEAGIIVIFQVGSLHEARKVIRAGADGVIVQGFEAGGHIRGDTRLKDLLPRVREALRDKLVIGAGGIYDHQSAAACRALGADAVCSGTRFLMTPESHAHEAYKARLLNAAQTIVTRLFGIGWPAPHRVAPNGATQRWCDADGRFPAWLSVVQQMSRLASRLPNADKSLRKMIAGQSIGRPFFTPVLMTREMPVSMLEVLALYAGECVCHIHELKPAAEVVDDLC
jgi:nitronate monooxygenase